MPSMARPLSRNFGFSKLNAKVIDDSLAMSRRLLDLAPGGCAFLCTHSSRPEGGLLQGPPAAPTSHRDDVAWPG